MQDVLIAVDLSRKTFKRIWLNYIWALGYNVCMIPFAAGALYAPLQFQLPPWVSCHAYARCLSDLPFLVLSAHCHMKALIMGFARQGSLETLLTCDYSEM